MPKDSFYDGRLPGADTVLRFGGGRDTLPGSQEQPCDVPNWPRGHRVDDFLIEEVLGSGVTSTVYRVLQLSTGKHFALKLLRVRCAETLAASRLGYRRVMPISHPSLVRIHGLHKLEGMIAFTMDEVVGEPFDTHVKRLAGDRKQLFQLAARLLHDVGSALQTLHAAGLVHRDVKPDNLRVEPSGHIRLLDYGLVGCYDPDSDPDARRSYLAGTFWYMAPESIARQIYPPACDVYSLGCVLLELIADSGRLPDPRKGISLGEAVGELDKVIPTDTPDELRELLHEMLDPEIGNRPLASQLVRYGHLETASRGSVSMAFRPTDLIGRETEMTRAEEWCRDVGRTGAGWLHLYGEPGTGKTWFANELRRRLGLHSWLQVFASTCFRREDVSLQLFDEIADAIARRYRRDDREPVPLSPTSFQILSQSFPSLAPIIRNTGEPAARGRNSQAELAGRPGGEQTRWAAHQSGVEFVNGLCEYGPVLLVIDDLQWADQDGIDILDAFLEGVTGKFGIVTVSRDAQPPLRHTPQEMIALAPFNPEQSLRLLRNVLGSAPLAADAQALATLTKIGQGNAFRLIQLAAGLANEEESGWYELLREGAVDADQLWHSKFDSLEPSSQRCLQFLATAGGPVNTEMLSEIAALQTDVDLIVWELIRHRLVRESTSDKSQIEIAHSRIADRVVRSLTPAEKAEFHLQWAAHLQRCDAASQPPQFSYAPRIAAHLLKAGKTREAAPYAYQAAVDALQRFAHLEAAKWFARAAELMGHEHASEPLHRALECYETAGNYGEAANICQTLLNRMHGDLNSADAAELQQRLAENRARCDWTANPHGSSD